MEINDMRLVIDNTVKVTTVNKQTITLLKRNLLSDNTLFDLVEKCTDEEAAAKVTQIVKRRLDTRFPNLQKTFPLVYSRYFEILSDSIQEKVEECMMPMF